jgi:hypothetical protein
VIEAAVGVFLDNGRLFVRRHIAIWCLDDPARRQGRGRRPSPVVSLDR